jgi:hypothetical protein
MKVYMLTDADFEKLLLKIDRDPKHGNNGGSSDSSVRNSEEQVIWDKVHRFYNYQLRTWIDEVKG